MADQPSHPNRQSRLRLSAYAPQSQGFPNEGFPDAGNIYSNETGIPSGAQGTGHFVFGSSNQGEFESTAFQFSCTESGPDRDILSDINAAQLQGSQVDQNFPLLSDIHPSLGNPQPEPWALVSLEAGSAAALHHKRPRAESPRGSCGTRPQARSISQASQSESTPLTPWNTNEGDTISNHSEATYFSHISSRRQPASRPAYLPSERTADAAGSELHCNKCDRSCKNQSDYNKHQKIHDRPYKCIVKGCKKAEIGFATDNDLDRHQCNVHKNPSRKKENVEWKCPHTSCSSYDKPFSRKDNFCTHLKNIHFIQDGLDELAERAKVDRTFFTSSMFSNSDEDGSKREREVAPAEMTKSPISKDENADLRGIGFNVENTTAPGSSQNFFNPSIPPSYSVRQQPNPYQQSDGSPAATEQFLFRGAPSIQIREDSNSSQRQDVAAVYTRDFAPPQRINNLQPQHLRVLKGIRDYELRPMLGQLNSSGILREVVRIGIQSAISHIEEMERTISPDNTASMHNGMPPENQGSLTINQVNLQSRRASALTSMSVPSVSLSSSSSPALRGSTYKTRRPGSLSQHSRGQRASGHGSRLATSIYCCNCKDGPHVSSNHDKCSNCSHEYCSECSTN